MIFLFLFVDETPKCYNDSQFAWLQLEQLFKNITNSTVFPKIQRTSQGKPYFSQSNWYFNLSHSKGLVAITLAKEPVGVDIQRWKSPLPSLVQRVCSTEEQAWLLGRKKDEDSGRDFAFLWSGKEACIKYFGLGVGSGRALPLWSVSPMSSQEHVTPPPCGVSQSLSQHVAHSQEVDVPFFYPPLDNVLPNDRPPHTTPNLTKTLTLTRWEKEGYSVALCTKNNIKKITHLSN